MEDLEMNKSNLEDYAEIAIGTYLLGEFFSGIKIGPTKKELQKQKEAAIRKRNKATNIYFKAGKLWADYSDKGVNWTEEIKEDPFHLY